MTALVGLPGGTTAPPPGSLVPGAHVQVLDRQLGIVAVELPRAGSRRALARLRSAPGVRYATVPAPGGGLASARRRSARSSACWPRDAPEDLALDDPPEPAQRGRLHGGDRRLGRGPQPARRDARSAPTPELHAGIGRDGARRARPRHRGREPDRAAVARTSASAALRPMSGSRSHASSSSGACNAATIAQNLIAAFKWFRSIGDVQIVNVSANIPPNPALIESLRALQQTGTLVVAATGNCGESREGHLPGVPAARARGRRARQQHEDGVGEIGTRARRSTSSRRAAGSGVDLLVVRQSRRAVRRRRRTEPRSRARSSPVLPRSSGPSTRRGTRAASLPR